MSTPTKKKAAGLSWITMALLTTTAVASVRGLPAMAPYGLASIFLYVLPAIVFLVPVALVAAELASGWNGGVFGWVKAAYGDRMGFVAIWQQWMQNVVWFPAQLAFFAGALAYVFNPDLGSNGVFVGATILIVYWLATLISLRGMSFTAFVGSKGLIVGTLIPAAMLVVMALIYLAKGGQSELETGSGTSWLPAFTGIASIVLIVSNFLAYAGMEMNAVHVTDMINPKKGFPKAIGLASILILLVFIPPTLAIAVGVPAKSVDLTTGVMQAFDVFFQKVGIPWGTSVMALLIVVGILASVVTWIPGPSRGLLLVAKDGYLPPTLQKTNAAGVQINILIVQGIIVSILALLFAVVPNVSSAFWILSAMAVQLYLIMYMIMFLAALKLRRTQPDVVRGFRTPAMKLVGWVGFAASVLAFLIGFAQPTGSNINNFIYVGFLLAGILVLGCGPFIFYALRKPSWIALPEAEPTDTTAASNS
ncbi:MAG: APC family permease [Candidatus Nanopelagicales bacterium]|jgi:putative glutamate/gamma-aminobutyrate antiporter